MQKTVVLKTLKQIKPLLIEQFGIIRLALFGSTARNEATDNSDVDILVSFAGIATSQRYFGVQFYLEDCLGCRVDLVTDKAVRPQLRAFIEQEAIDV
jgi:predicted nucleotidyltransferase